ncbi:MAG: hypothetical protein ACYDCM_09270 [Candidatus Acidiferrales bacterium]
MGENDTTDENPKEKEQEHESKSVGSEISLFIDQIDGLAETLALVMPSIVGVLSGAAAETRQFLEELGLRLDVPDAERTVTVAGSKVLRLQGLMQKLSRARLVTELVPRSLVVSLVSQFDAYLGRLVRRLFIARPEILNASENTLTFSELMEFESVENAREVVIEREVESLLRRSHSDQFGWLEKTFGLQLRKDLEVWPVFIELTERRNLFVHANGVVSRQYLEVCRRNACRIPEDFRPGQTLSITTDYFVKAYECILEIGVKLGQVLWRKVLPGEIDAPDGNLNRVSYGLLSEGKYPLARMLLNFGTETLPKHSSEESRLIMVVNRAQSYKWSGDGDTCKAIVNKEDWSAKGLKFKMAQAILLDDFASAIEFAKSIGAHGELN